jgi:hypothetical protein
MTQFGEGTATVNFKPDDPEDGKKRIKIRVCVFFDGTGNNRANIDQRLLAKIDPPKPEKTILQRLMGKDADSPAPDDHPLTAEERAWAEQLKKDKTSEDTEKARKTYRKYGKPGADNSYEGYYTNVVKMDRHVADTTPGYTLTLQTYIDGSGTIEKKGDEKAGLSMAMGDSGVPAKVETGVRNVIELIKKKQRDKTPIIELLTLDVFGFSRGATGARKFINDALFGRRALVSGRAAGNVDPSTSIREQLQNMGYEITGPGKNTGVKVCFAGLYDTVSTYGMGVRKDDDDNVAELSLNAVFHAEETLHLTAADEHRYHFSLTSTKSAGKRGREICLPGAHSDIGGGYRDMAEENTPILGSTSTLDNFGLIDGVKLQGSDATPQEIEHDRKQLMAAGWFKENEIEIENHDSLSSKGVLTEKRVLSIRRSGIHNSYSKIPLNIMVKQARAKGVVFKTMLDDVEAVPDELKHVNGVDIPAVIQKYIGEQGNYSSRAAHWHFNDKPWIKTLRNKFFHFSAVMSMGYDPRIEGGKRKRKIYNG